MLKLLTRLINAMIAIATAITTKLAPPKRMRVPLMIIFCTLGAVILGGTLWILANNAGSGVPILRPMGEISLQQRDLIVGTVLLSLVVVIPVYILTFGIAWKYRASNKKATYRPEWDHHNVAEFVWWTVPLVIILILAGVTWRTSHSLDPYRPLQSTVEPVRVQVVALPWKWLFIYKDYSVASVNELHIPVNTPINFEITSDAPMNSFWIPQLGSQVYAMPGMTTKLHLNASEPGVYRGSSANLSGDGFAGMHFDTTAMPAKDFEQWLRGAKSAPRNLTFPAYEALAQPSKDQKPLVYGEYPVGLYDTVINKYMGH